MAQAHSVRTFRVHARDLDSHSRLVIEPSFEAAAIAYAEDLPAAAEAEISIVVRDVETGHEHCFRVDPDTGETAACG
jgi:hypothetical protein